MLVRTFIVLAAIAVALALFFGPWGAAGPSGQSAAEPAVGPVQQSPAELDTVLLARPEQANGSGERTQRVAEASTPPSARTFTCRVTGRVVDALGKPLPKARLAHGVHAIQSGRDGRFQLDLVLPLNQLGDGQTLVAGLEWYVTRSLKFTAAEQIELGDVVLAAAGSFSGHVVDADGKGVAGAEVLTAKVIQIEFISRDVRPLETLEETRTDNAGAFRLANLGGGAVRLWAGAPGMLWAYMDDLRVKLGEETRDIVLRLEPRGSKDEILLLVIDPQGEPVPLARIDYYYYSGEGRSGAGSGRADELGRYRYPVPYNATYDFMARDPNDRYRPATARSVPPGATERVLQLGEARELVILVSDPRGEPVPEFTASCRTWLDDRPLSGQSAKPDHDETPGRAVIQLPLEHFDISVVAAGFQNATVESIDPGAVGTSIQVLLTPLPGVKGRVVDGAGRPVEGATVGLHEVVGDDRFFTVNGFPCRSRKGASARTTSDADGKFDLTLREAGHFFLRASSEGLAPGETGPFDLAPDLATDGLVVVLGEGGTIAGRVIVALGESPAGRIVGASRADGFGVTVRTGEDGGYSFTHLIPGRWFVQGRRDDISANFTNSSSRRSDDHKQLPWSCSVAEGQITRFDLDLSRVAVVVVEGSFLLSGAPAVGCKVTIREQANQRTVATDTVDSQGNFRLELDAAGAYRLQIVGQWEDSPTFFVLQDLTLGAGTQAWSRDLPLGRIEGTTSFAQGDRWRYSWSGDEELRVYCVFSPSDSGTFELPVPAGPGILKFLSPAGQEIEREIEVQAGVTLRVDLQ